MSGLPSMVHGDGIKKSVQVKFKGYDHNLGAEEGSLWDMENLSGDSAPVLAPRKPRYLLRTLEKPNGLYAGESLCWADGGSFYVDGEQKGAVEDSRKQFCALGDYLILLPDKAYYNKRTGEFGSLEAQWSGGVRFEDGVFAGESAKGNSIVSTGEAFPFSVNEAVTISGCGEERNNKTAVIREVSEDGKTLRFYENSFQVWSGEAALKREVPDMDFLCENENRLWGCKGDTIFASKLGDPFNWNVFDGLSTDSFSASVGSAGDFTGAVAYLGYPMFFKESGIYKIYGDKPGNFQVVASSSVGVAKGCERSLCVTGDILFYVSRNGVMAYTGAIPQNISSCFGRRRLEDGRAGTDGIKYYLSVRDYNTIAGYELFVYDTATGLWHREDDFKLVFAALDANGELCAVKTDINNTSFEMWTLGHVRTGNPTETNIASFCEFGDLTETAPNRKGVSKIQLRLYIAPGAQATVKIKYDSESDWHTVKTLSGGNKDSYYLPVIPKRCDHFRLRIEGVGAWRLYSLTRECYTGSELL